MRSKSAPGQRTSTSTLPPSVQPSAFKLCTKYLKRACPFGHSQTVPISTPSLRTPTCSARPTNGQVAAITMRPKKNRRSMSAAHDWDRHPTDQSPYAEEVSKHRRLVIRATGESQLRVIRVNLACPSMSGYGGISETAQCPVLPVEGIGLNVIQASKAGPKISGMNLRTLDGRPSGRFFRTSRVAFRVWTAGAC